MQADPKTALKVIQWVDPDDHTSVDIATVDSEVDTTGWRYALIIVNIGDSLATWDIQVNAAATAGGTPVAVTGAVFNVGTTDDDTRMIGVIDLYKTTLNVNPFLTLSGTGSAAAVDLGVTLVLCAPDYTTERLDFASGGADELTFELITTDQS